MDLANIRLQNALLLRDHFARKWRAESDERARTVETSFASLIEVNPSHWSQIKSGHRHIGEKLGRQIEVKCRVPELSLDHAAAAAFPQQVMPDPVLSCANEEERSAMQLFQVLYRMNPHAAKLRLLDVLQQALLKQHADQDALSSVASAAQRQRNKR